MDSSNGSNDLQSLPCSELFKKYTTRAKLRMTKNENPFKAISEKLLLIEKLIKLLSHKNWLQQCRTK